MQDLDADVAVDEETAPADVGLPGRRRRIAALAAVAVALVLPPLLAYAAFGAGTDQPRDFTGVRSAPDGGYGVNAPDADPPSDAPGGTAPGSAQQPWQAADLASATLTLDAWRPSPAGSPPCPTGKVAFTGSSAAVPGRATVRLLQNTLVDVDHDGTYEVAVVLFCQDSQAGTYQAIVLKPAAGGGLTTMGQLARSGPDGEDIVAVTPASGGLVNLTVGNIIPCCGTPQSLQLTQIRTFAWQRSGFTQVAGPTTFTADRSAADLDISAPAVHFTGLLDGKSAGTLTVTIRNRGKRDVARVSVAVWPDQPLAPAAGGDWARCVTRDGTSRAVVCPIGELPAGETATLTLPLSGLFGSQATTVQPRIGDQTYETLRVPSYYS